MLDRHDAQEGPEDAGLNRAQRGDPANRGGAGRPMADREVPLPSGHAAGLADVDVAVHQWLDGDVTETVARRADTKQVDLWNRISEETERRRRMTTPAYVPDRIMAALPDKAPATSASLWVRSISLAPATAFLAAAGLVALGIVIGRLALQ